jgi:cytochrome P450
MWLPKFLNYHPVHDEKNCIKERHNMASLSSLATSTKELHAHTHKATKKMASSSITNILPRMERLNGPYGMYATVYGLSMKVVHIAHPIPARIVLTGESSYTNKRKHRNKVNNKRHGGGVGVAYSQGAIKNPAYDHFENLFGNAVFTADGADWKAKRASVLHCLLKGCTKDESKESQRLENEANFAADNFINIALAASTTSSSSIHASPGNIKKSINIVKLLQRSTIGLIYRFLTHHDINLTIDIPSKASDSNVNTFGESLPTSTSAHHTYSDDESTHSTSSLSSTSSITAANMNTNSNTAPKSKPRDIDIRNSHAVDDTSMKPYILLSSYLEAITNIRMIILAQSRSIWFLLPRWIYRLFSPMYKEEDRVMESIREFAQTACMNALPGSPLHSLRSRKSHNPNQTNNVIDGRHVNKQLLDEAITILFAGQDTSAATLSWTLHLLSLYPHVQERLAEEICTALDKQSGESYNESMRNDHKSSYKRVNKKVAISISYLDAVIKEAMRLYPVAPFVVRQLPDELIIPPSREDESSNCAREVTLPQNTLACIWIYGLHRNKQFWHRPNDFVPERWIDPKLQDLDAGQRNGSFMPFAAGPRNCVGQPIAHVVLRIMLAKIVYVCKFHDARTDEFCKFSNSNDDEWISETIHLRKDMQAGFTVLPTGGVDLEIRARKSDK